LILKGSAVIATLRSRDACRDRVGPASRVQIKNESERTHLKTREFNKTTPSLPRSGRSSIAPSWCSIGAAANIIAASAAARADPIKNTPLPEQHRAVVTADHGWCRIQ
jgi:hypothetical protein